MDEKLPPGRTSALNGPLLMRVPGTARAGGSRVTTGGLLFAAVLFVSLSAQAQSPVRHGRELAKEFCSRCHAIGRYDKSHNPSALPFRRLSQKIDLESLPRRLQRGLAASHPAMPEFRFKPRDAHALRDYLRTIQE